MECRICFETFNEFRHSPHFFKNCGHIVCRSCIKNLALQSFKKSEGAIACPICRKNHFFKIKNEPNFEENICEYENQFPRVYLPDESSKCKKPNPRICDHERNTFYCLDWNCTSNSFCCLKCFGLFHQNCDEKSNNDFKLVFKQFLQVSNEFRTIFDFEETKKMIKDEIDQLEKLLVSIAESYSKEFFKEVETICKVPCCFDAFEQWSDNFEFDKSIDSEVRLIFKRENVDNLVKTTEGFNRMFEEFFEEAYFWLEKSILMKFDGIEKFKDQKFQGLFDFKNRQFFNRKNGLLRKMKTFEFEEYFKNQADWIQKNKL